MAYISGEKVVRDYVAGRFPDAYVCTETPPNLADVLPVIQVELLTGVDGTISFNHSRIDVDVFAATRDEARELAENVRADLITDAIGRTVAGAVISDATTLSTPHKAVWDNSNVRRFVATYDVTTHNNPN